MGDAAPDVMEATMPPGTESALAKAQTLLESLLEARAVPTLEIRERATSAGLSWMTVRRAAATLKCASRRAGFGAAGCWRWEFPR
jgi:hypothetical protein